MHRLVRTASAVALLCIATACSSGGSSSTGTGAAGTTVPGATTTVARPIGPAATFAPLDGGEGISLVASGGDANPDFTEGENPAKVIAGLSAQVGEDLKTRGWVQEEYAVSGDATAYAGETPADGTFTLKETTKADYTTRVVVRRPAKAADFNGTVVVEWLNVSGGVDAAPDWTYLQDELIRGGFAWVGVSAQHIGIEGGMVAVSTPVSELAAAGIGLIKGDPARYGDLHHPGDAYSYDIFTQVARGLRNPEGAKPLGDLVPEHLLAAGESQSAFMLTTYVDGIQPLTEAFDGFLIHSRGGASAPLGEPDEGIGIAGTLGREPTKIRTDGTAPIIVVETESDVAGLLGYLPARQDDDARFRLWEIAGTAHVDRYQLGFIADSFGCTEPVNAGPHAYVVKAALAALHDWVADGTAPPEAPRLEVDADGQYVTDEDEIVKGGIRTPLVDVPVDRLTGVASTGGDVACTLAGQTVALSPERLSERYDSVEDYTSRFETSTDDAIAAGFVLKADRDAMLAEAQPGRLAG